jgi:hypothetical protein
MYSPSPHADIARRAATSNARPIIAFGRIVMALRSRLKQDARAASQCNMDSCIRIQFKSMSTSVTEMRFAHQKAPINRRLLNRREFKRLESTSAPRDTGLVSSVAVVRRTPARSAFAAGVRAITDLRPVAFPFFAPRKVAAANRAGLLRKIALGGHRCIEFN